MDDQPVDPQARPYGSDDLVCPRHPDRVSHLRCRTCGRPACAECQRPGVEAGFDCVDCHRTHPAPTRPAGVNPPWQVRPSGSFDGAAAAPYAVGGAVEGNETGATVATRPARPIVTFVIGGVCLLAYL